ncbi:thiamine phosphate synthase [Sulfurivirga sp.]|uniref:thiamine phosphate synthase n=1 Tax=Sulfurivirga sp. TaxID=2614236 RepID=UPI0025F8110C|nr:thiamine phosphate synthase [Sulfurivirga sp.]
MKGLYAITDPYLTPGEALFEAVQAALDGGTRMLQYRDKLHEAGDRLRIAQRLRELTAAHRALLIINDDIALAAAVEADGVHLGKEDASLEAAREKLGDDALIGISCYADLARARQAAQAGASYVAFGRVFPSRTKPHATPAPLSLITRAKTELDVPVVAIGGITLENIDRVVTAGADMAAVIHGLFGQNDIRAAAEAFCAAFKS